MTAPSADARTSAASAACQTARPNDGAVWRRSVERLAYFTADPVVYAEAAGLALDRPPADLGGVGEVWVFRRR